MQRKQYNGKKIHIDVDNFILQCDHIHSQQHCSIDSMLLALLLLYDVMHVAMFLAAGG